MAKCIAGGFAAETRGKVGGLVFNSWRGVGTLKIKHAPAQPRTNLQLAVRAIMIMLARKWQSLSNQADWNQYATDHPFSDWTNSPKRLTGMNWYCMLGLRLSRLGIPIVATPPEVVAPDPVTGLTAVGAAGSVTVDWSTPSAHTDSVEIWLHGPHSAGRLGSLVKAKYNCSPWGDEGGLSISGLQAGVYDVYVRVCSRTNGLVSAFVGDQTVVT
jgi:hypothetical protein